MSKTLPRVQFNFLEDEIADEIEPVAEMIEDVDDEDDPTALAMPQPVERESIEREDIFEAVAPEPQNQLLKELVQKELPKQKKQPKVKEVKLTKSGKPRKPMTEAEKLHLANGRKKALEARKLKKIERDNQKEIDKEEKELLKKKKQKDFEKLKKEVEDPDPTPAPVQPQAQAQMFSRKDLEDAQLSAIISYEKIRAQRKKEKQEQQLIEAQKQDIRNKLTKAPGTYQSAYNSNNRFYGCY